jgi:hypothetical protein
MSKRNLERRVRPLLFMIESVGMGKELWSAVDIPLAGKDKDLDSSVAVVRLRPSALLGTSLTTSRYVLNSNLTTNSYFLFFLAGFFFFTAFFFLAALTAFGFSGGLTSG